MHVEEGVQSFIEKGFQIPRAKAPPSHDMAHKGIFGPRRHEFKDVTGQGASGQWLVAQQEDPGPISYGPPLVTMLWNSGNGSPRDPGAIRSLVQFMARQEISKRSLWFEHIESISQEYPEDYSSGSKT